MARIGGNITGILQVKETARDEKGEIITNEIGEAAREWVTACELLGWLGLNAGDSKYVNYLTKLEESTHTFLCDFSAGAYALADRDCRMIVKGFVYDVLLIDNPDEMDQQLEISLKRVGAWRG